MKKVSIIFILVILLSSCSVPQKETYVNNSNNIFNTGDVAQLGNTVYKIERDNTKSTLLKFVDEKWEEIYENEKIYCLNSAERSLFFFEKNQSGSVIKKLTETQQIEKVCSFNESIDNLYYINESFYALTSSRDKIIKIEKNGETKEIYSGKIIRFTVSEKYIFLVLNDFCVYRIDIKTNSKVKVTDGNISSMCVSGNDLYYILLDSGKLCLFKDNGETTELITNKKLNALNIRNNIIVYSALEDDKEAIYCTNIDLTDTYLVSKFTPNGNTFLLMSDKKIFLINTTTYSHSNIVEYDNKLVS